MNEAGLTDMKVSDITEEQFNKLLGVHIKHESGALYGWMKENGYVNDNGINQSFFEATTPTTSTTPSATTETTEAPQI